MVLFVQEGCQFCDQIKDVPDLVVTRVVETPSGPKLDFHGHLLEMPIGIPGFPALLDDKKMYVGLTVVKERLGLAA